MTNVIQKIWRDFPLRRYLSLRLLIGLGFSVLCMVVFAAIADSVVDQETLTIIDNELAHSLYNLATTQTTAIFRFISLFGSQIVFLLTLIVAVYYVWKRLWLHLSIWLIALAGGEVLNLILKEIFARSRPEFEVPLAVEINYSFPSGHAMMSMIAYGMLAYFLMIRITNFRARILIVFSVTLLIVLIAISRMYLGVHFLSDVVAGIAAGGVWIATCIGTMEFLRARSSSREKAAEAA